LRIANMAPTTSNTAAAPPYILAISQVMSPPNRHPRPQARPLGIRRPNQSSCEPSAEDRNQRRAAD
jgi:hypothetical protein